MAHLVILGTANAIPDDEHDNTHLAVVGEGGVVLVDCGGSPMLRLRQAGIDPDAITDLIATHFHPDHVSGIPLLADEHVAHRPAGAAAHLRPAPLPGAAGRHDGLLPVAQLARLLPGGLPPAA